MRDPATLRRIEALVIPPAWEDTWICADPRGHLQATGRDARGRKQYRYHAEWSRLRSADKYCRLLDFARALPRIRRRTAKDLALPGLPREKVLALVVRLLETTHARIGNEEYSRENRSYGLTTLHDGHALDGPQRVRLVFRGKSGVVHDIAVTDPRLVALVRRCRELPGHELFQHVDARGVPHGVDSGDVNAYIRRISGGDFTAKDFRTWIGTCLAADALRETAARSPAKEIVAAIRHVARGLGNRPATCRKHYIHPAILEAHVSGLLRRVRPGRAPGAKGLRQDERIVLDILRRAEKGV